MSYQEIHEWYVICDECHTRLFVGDTTEEDVDNEAADHGWQCDELQGRHYCPSHWHLECHDCDVTDSGAPDELEAAGWHIDRDYPCDSLCPPPSRMPRMPQVGRRTAAPARIRRMADQLHRPQRQPLPGMRQNKEGHEMRINFNSKDGVFAIKAENEEEKTQLKTSAVAICNLIIDFFDGEVQEMKAAKE